MCQIFDESLAVPILCMLVNSDHIIHKPFGTEPLFVPFMYTFHKLCLHPCASDNSDAWAKRITHWYPSILAQKISTRAPYNSMF